MESRLVWQTGFGLLYELGSDSEYRKVWLTE